LQYRRGTTVIPSSSFRSRTPRRTGAVEPAYPFTPIRPEDLRGSAADYFERIVAREPERRAVCSRTRALTYDALNQWANRVARYLLARRPVSDEPVALLFAHGTEAIPALLGALKSGKPYVALDSSYPLDRLRFVIEKMGAGLLLHDAANLQLAEELARHLGVPIGCIDEADSRYGTDNLALPLAPDRPCFVIFTSGSTGRPKGVTFTHRLRLQSQMEFVNRLHVSPHDRLTALHSIGFGVSVSEIYGALMTGASLYPLDLRQEGFSGLTQWLREHEISLFQWTPSAFRRFASELPAVEQFPHLRMIVLGGEPVTPREVALYQNRFSARCLLVNRYGATETANTCYYVMGRSTPLPTGVMPVGYPVERCELLILDEAGAPLPPGTPGEIAVKSGCLAAGYWQEPELTAARFQALPGEEARIYRTGDLGRQAADGCLEHLGRKDDQIKVRGYRIELLEVDAALLKLPGVRNAAAAAFPDAAGETRIAGYLVSEPGRTLSIEAVREALRLLLPSYMVPSSFSILSELPLTPTGKVQRSALPPPAASAPARDAPRSEVERRLAAAWEVVLDVREPGVHESFFELGGNSLRVVQLLARIEREFGRTLPLASLVSVATIARQALLIEGVEPLAGASVLVPIQPAGSRPALFGVHGIGGGVLCYRDLAAHLGAEQPFYGLQAPALAGQPAEYLTVEQMAELYVRAIREVQPTGPYHLLGLSFGGLIALEMAQQLARAGERVALLGLLDSTGPGYPRFPSRLRRMVAHLRYFLAQPAAGRGHYVKVRAEALRDLLRRRCLGTWYRRVYRSGDTLPRLLDDIGIGHIQAAREYRRSEYPGEITLFRAELQPIGCIPEWDNGWSPVARGGVEVLPVPGEHASMVEEPHVAALAAAVESALARSIEP